MRSKIFSRVGALLGTFILVITSMSFLSYTASAQEAFPPEIPKDIPVSPNIPKGSSGSGVQGFVPAIGSRAKDTAGKKQLAQFGKAEVEMLLQHGASAEIDKNEQQQSVDKFYWNLQVSCGFVGTDGAASTSCLPESTITLKAEDFGYSGQLLKHMEVGSSPLVKDSKWDPATKTLTLTLNEIGRGGTTASIDISAETKKEACNKLDYCNGKHGFKDAVTYPEGTQVDLQANWSVGSDSIYPQLVLENTTGSSSRGDVTKTVESRTSYVGEEIKWSIQSTEPAVQNTYRDFIPKGLEFVRVEDGTCGPDMSTNYDPSTRLLTVTCPGSFVHKGFQIVTKATTTGKFTNTVYDTKTYMDGRRITNTASDYVNVVDVPLSTPGHFAKYVRFAGDFTWDTTRSFEKYGKVQSTKYVLEGKFDNPRGLKSFTMTDNLMCLDSPTDNAKVLYEEASNCKKPGVFPTEASLARTPFSVEATLADGSKRKFNSTLDKDIDYFTSYKVKFPDEIYKKIRSLKFTVTPTKPEEFQDKYHIWVGVDVSSDAMNGDVLRNVLHAQYTSRDGATSDSVTTRPADIRIEEKTSISTDVTEWLRGRSSGSVSFDYKYEGTKPLSTINLKAILPAGVDYGTPPKCEESGLLKLHYSAEGIGNDNLCVPGEVRALEDGGTEMIFHLAPEVMKKFFPEDDDVTRNVHFSYDPTIKGGDPGVNYEFTAEEYLNYQYSPSSIFRETHYINGRRWDSALVDLQDTNDGDNDPHTNIVSRSVEHIQFPFPDTGSGSILKKEVKGDLDKFYKFPEVSSVSPERRTADFRLTWKNMSSDEDVMNTLAIYDILPHKGDKGVSSVTVDRNSTTGATLAAAPKLTAVGNSDISGLHLEYTKSANACRPEIVDIKGCVNDWSAKVPADFSQIKGFRVVGDKVAFSQLQGVQIDFPAKIDKNANINDVIWNNAASRSKGKLQYLSIEAPKVGARVAKPEDITVKKEWDVPLTPGLKKPVTITVKAFLDKDGKRVAADLPEHEVVLNDENNWQAELKDMYSLDPETGKDLIWDAVEKNVDPSIQVSSKSTTTSGKLRDKTSLVVTNKEKMPTIDVEKYINGEDADTKDKAVTVIGSDKMDVRFDITNTGNKVLDRVTLTDVVKQGGKSDSINKLLKGATVTVSNNANSKLGTVNGKQVNGKIKLAPGGKATVTVTVPSAKSGELHEDNATVTGYIPGTNHKVTDEDPAFERTVRFFLPETGLPTLALVGGLSLLVLLGFGAYSRKRS